jgi:hypothetical protein
MKTKDRSCKTGEKATGFRAETRRVFAKKQIFCAF